MPPANMTARGQTWHRIFADSFNNQNTPFGKSCGDPKAFPKTTPKWDAYPYPWHGEPNGGSYCPGLTTSIRNGRMDVRLRRAQIGGSSIYVIDAALPRVAGRSAFKGQLYGRYAVEFYAPRAFPMFHVSWLLWPDSNAWPRDGEIDFPEADTDGSTIGAFMHRQGGTSGGDQDAYIVHTPFYGAWHTAAIEWLPTRCTFILDGKVIGNSTDAATIPHTPMHLVLQSGLSNDESSGSGNPRGDIYIDWVEIWKPSSAGK
jgi:glycosyl hydrolase family 16